MGRLIFKKSYIPNLLTILRILLIPFILSFLFIDINVLIYEFSLFENNLDFKIETKVLLNYLMTGILFLIASFTDFLDGYLSRKFNWVSDFGKIWDPIADKVLITSLFIALSIKGVIPWFLVVIIVIRDLIVDGYRTFLASKQIIVSANMLGKVKTVLQMISLFVVLFIFNGTSNNIAYYLLQNGLLFVATLMTVISGIYYLVIANLKLKNLSLN